MIHCGDSLTVLRSMPGESVDAVVTDPPYGLTSGRNGRSPATQGAVFKGFMGLEWDGDVPPVALWAELRRVAKPGANLLSFGATRRQHRLVCAIEDAGWEIHDTIAWIYGHGYPKSKGSLKPALELVTVARNGGPRALNTDACRIPVDDPAYARNFSGDCGHEGTRSIDQRGATDMRMGGGKRPKIECRSDPAKNTFGDGINGSSAAGETDLGRWPANVAHDGSEDVLSLFPEGSTFRGDSGSAARFFYCARASKAERGEGNTHPTVKPLALMRWLVRLATPPGGMVLDPFMGSGSTGVAALSEGFQFIGIEREPAYVEMANRRIGNVAPLFNQEFSK